MSYRSSDQDLRAAQRRYMSSPGDGDTREMLMSLERRVGMTPSEFEVRSFEEALRDAAVANELHPERGEFPTMSRHLLSLVSFRSTRDKLRWAWFRVTYVQWGTSPPLAMTVRKADRVVFVIGRHPTGDRNVLAPQLVWPELGPNWFPGAHEHGAVPAGSPNGHEYRTSWDEADLDRSGLCRICGDNPKEIRVANERPVFEKKLDEFAFGKADPYTARPASMRTVSASLIVVRSYLKVPVSTP